MKPTRAMVARLRSMNALPDAYIVENYRAEPPPNYMNVVGEEHQVETVASVALWIANTVPASRRHVVDYSMLNC